MSTYAFLKRIIHSNIWLRIQYFLFGNVDKILDQFIKAASKLDKAVEFHEARAQAAIQAQQAAQLAQANAEASKAKAQTAATNIRNLLGE